jgi:AcrR family transcriptional regulator
MTETTARPVDPRIERTRQVVLAATSELVAELGYSDVTIEAISERSGVARSTIYRHWKQLPALMLDAIAATIQGADPPDTGELRADLVLLVGELAELLTSERFSQIAIALIVESHRDPDIAEVHARFLRGRQQRTVAAIQRGIERGELPATVDPPTMAFDLAAPVFFRALVQHQPVDKDFVEQHVDRWLSIHRQIGTASPS